MPIFDFLNPALPAGLRTADLLVVGVAASIGFTVSLFFATAAFPTGVALAETKMGALFSFFAAPLAIAAARILRVPRQIAMHTPAQQSADGQPMR